MDSGPCECEHASHFEPSKWHGFTHPYGVLCEPLMALKTPGGTFNVCQHCADTCYKEWNT